MLFVNIFYQEAAWILFSYGREFHATCPSNTRNLIYIHIVAFNETCNSEICKNGDWDRYCRCCIHVSLSSAHIGIWEGMAILPACLPALLLLLFSGTSCNTRKIRGPVSVELCTDYQFYVTLLNVTPYYVSVCHHLVACAAVSCLKETEIYIIQFCGWKLDWHPDIFI